jgi:hypothetical protein
LLLSSSYTVDLDAAAAAASDDEAAAADWADEEAEAPVRERLQKRRGGEDKAGGCP